MPRTPPRAGCRLHMLASMRCTLPWLLIAPLLASLLAQDQPAPPDPTQRRFAVPMRDGHVQADDLLRALLTAYEFDGDAVPLPSLRVDLRGTKGTALLYACRKLLLETTRFRRDIDRQELIVTIDRERARDLRRQLRQRLARLGAKLAGEDLDEHPYDLALPQPLDPERLLVVLVHGVESSPESLDDLRHFLVDPARGRQVATFAYPNDASIDEIAAVFAARLRALGAQPVAVVGHSMGGLVARAAIENPRLDPGNVRKLVLIGTPNAGSSLAGLRIALEAKSLLADAGGERAFARELVAAFVEHWQDGLGEAGGDLLPDSVFLTRLAARERNPRTDYHVVLGTRSLLTPEQLAAVQREVGARLATNRIGRLVRPKLERWLRDLDELVDGKGDGAVGVASGQLPGIEPVLVPLDHLGLVRLRGLLGIIPAGRAHPVFEQVAVWLPP